MAVVHGGRKWAVPLVMLSLISASSGSSALAADCEFRLGFRALHDQIPEIVGTCLAEETHNPENGDALQPTSRGLMVWRKRDNWTAFTDGLTTWINGPLGLQSRPNDQRFAWEPAPTSSPGPSTSNQQTQRAIDDAAQRLGLAPSAITLLSVEPRDWPDASLGCPKPNALYAQVITPGYLIVLQAAGQRLEYHTDLGNRLETC